MSGASASPTCAVHSDRPAQSICARCGNFVCVECSDYGTYESCPSCRALTGELPGFTWTRETFSLDGLMGFAWENFKREWVMLSLAALVFMAVLFGASLATNLLQVAGAAIHPVAGGAMQLVSTVVQNLVQGVLTGGLVAVLYGVMKGQAADIGRMFSQFSSLGAYAVATLLQFVVVIVPVAVMAGIAVALRAAVGRDAMAVAIIVGVVVLIIPAIWVLLPFTLVPMEIALGGETNGTQAVKNAFAIARGKRLWMVLFGIVSGFILLVGALLCCIGVLPAFALTQMLTTALYLALRNGSGLQPMRGTALQS